MKTFFLALLLSATLVAAASAETAPPSSASVAQLARSSNAFGFDLYQRLRQKPGNLVVSPASVTTALTMAWGGARGETAAQMQGVLHLEGTADEAMTTSGELARALQDPGRPVVFRIANRLFAEKTYKLVPAYVEKTRTAFGAPVESLDFKKASEAARAHVNQWVEGKTQHRIQNLVPPRGILPETRLMLVNAIYFLGDWADPFKRDETRAAPFHLTASKAEDVPTMHRTSGFRIAHQDGVTALELPYKGQDLSMLLLVPDEVEGLAAVESALNAPKLDALVAALKGEWVELALPKFEVNPGDSLSLGEDLKALGMPLAFDPNLADFTGIADPPNPAARLVIAKVFHKGFVRVDEKGTEAAAATAVLARETGAALGDGPRPVHADRPFLFLIRDNASGLVLFLGRVSDPLKK
ncbi:MAG: serpin family protein [Thermoanaerobaculia bacterium]